MLFQQTRAYFASYHQVSMAELRIFLENETWTRCPVDESLNEYALIASLQEFAFIKNRLLKLGKSPAVQNQNRSTLSRNKSFSSPKSSTSSSFLLSPVTKCKNYFSERHDEQEQFDKQGSPFDDIFSLAISTTMYDDDESEVGEDEVLLDESQNESQQQKVPEVATTNTALNVLRLTGRYMHIMYLLWPISHDIIRALLELFDYYFFTVYRFFAVDALNTTWLSAALSSLNPSMPQQPREQQVDFKSQSGHFSQLSHELRSFIRRINDQLILNEYTQSQSSSSLANSSSTNQIAHAYSPAPCTNAATTEQGSNSASASSSPKRMLIKYPPPMLPDYVPINAAHSLFALPERIMAIESL